MKRNAMTAVAALGHFFVDLLCAWGMFRFCRPAENWMEAALFYNFCAFALQMPLGLLADRFRQEGSFALLGGLLVSGACAALGKAPMAFAVAAGLGNALYHVGGGVAVLHAWPKRAGPLGLFVSPGAFGIFFGTLLGKEAAPLLAPGIAGLLGLCLLLFLLRRGERVPEMDAEARGAGFFSLLCLFLVVCLRSYAGFLFAFPWKTGLWAAVFACGVVLGKAAGGYLADRFGAALPSAVSLGLSALLFLFSGNPVCGILAVFLFNMTMPVTLRAAADALPGMQGFSFGLLTFALFLGFLPAWLGLPAPAGGWFPALGAALSLALLLPGLRKRP